MAKKKKINFEASARLQRLIGRELIPNDSMAIVELVKNAYDSQATQVRILVQPDSPQRPGFIRVTDNGSGMTEQDIKRLFMVAGYSERLDQVNDSRTPTGEKGIGRFAADKLGERLDVFTKTKKSKQTIHLRIDWEDFDDRSKKFNDVQATYGFVPSTRLDQLGHGTSLEIAALRAKWDSSRIESLKTDLSDLLNPFDRPKDFRITLEIGNLRGEVEEHKLEAIVPDADLVMNISVVGGKVQRTIKRKGVKPPISDDRLGSDADLEYLRGLRARFLHFDKRPNKKATKGLAAGVRVYRDGFRIEPFGSRHADWLHIAEARAKRAGHAHIVPSRLFGFVEISRVSNPRLADTTSRQALLDSDTSRNLVTVLRTQLDALGDVLRASAEPRWEESRRKQAIEVEQGRLHTLGVMSLGIAHELRQPLQAIRSDADNIRKKLQLLGVDDEDINAAQGSIDRAVQRIDNNITLVSAIAMGSVTEKSKFDLAELVSKEASIFRTRASAASVEVQVKAGKQHAATLNQFAIHTVLSNFLQNSLQALEAVKRSGTIVVTLRLEEGQHYLEVKDDGDGVPEDAKAGIFQKFGTRKTGGMGVGLYYCKTIVESHGGEIGFDSTLSKGAKFWVRLPEG